MTNKNKLDLLKKRNLILNEENEKLKNENFSLREKISKEDKMLELINDFQLSIQDLKDKRIRYNNLILELENFRDSLMANGFTKRGFFISPFLRIKLKIKTVKEKIFK